MPGMPDLPVTIPKRSQVDGDIDREPVYQTHRGKKAKMRDVGSPPPEPKTPDVALRYEDDE